MRKDSKKLFHFDQWSKVFLIFVGFGLFVGCNGQSEVQFKGERRNTQIRLATKPQTSLSFHQGGIARGQTGSGYKIDVSLGVQANVVNGVTNSGYLIQMNAPGKIAY